MGVILTLLVVLVTGLIARNFVGRRLVIWWEVLLARIPVVNSVYHRQAGFRYALFLERQRLSQGAAGPVSARG